ncbi:MAG TPA: PQQ-binding-like beta-propeller repeat protein, partial [Candidatus Binatia bacterium]|nr:PQQ-binding-like beta-propeller repeat protein [Candidatus Binatia bacterium]
MSTANAGTLGVAWAADLYGAALDSPVVAYDPARKKMLAYVGTENGDMIAVNVASGRIVWSTWLGSPIRTTPAVSHGSVYAGTVNSARIYKLNASTGAIDCSVASPQPIEGTPVVATPPGGVRTLYVGTNDSISATGPTLTINAKNCKREWSFTGYNELSGSWVAVSYAMDAKKRPLVLFGTADRDSAVYAVNAVTGRKVWRFAVENPPPGVFDVATGATISPPGQVTTDGIAYVATKFGIMYALDLTTGKQIWSFNFNKKFGVREGGRSTAALDGDNLVFGYNGGVLDVTASGASAGTMKWSYQTPGGTEALSSPAIAGTRGSEIVAVGDLGGGFDVLSLATGVQLYRYRTGGYITASPAVSGGNILIASADGFLYDFAVGGGNDSALPKTTISSPADTSSLANPNGNLTVKGGATDAAKVSGVVVAVQEGGPDGRWWDAAAHRWVSGPVGNPAVLASPGSTSSSWKFSYPVPAAGGTYNVTAYAVSSSGQADIRGAQDKFAVRTTTKGPHLTASPAFVAPGSSTQVRGGGFARSEEITISLLGKALITTRANSRGNFQSTKVPIPPKAAFGQTSLTARGHTSGRSATVAITIANSWDQVGYGHGHTSVEPNDP